MWMQANYFHNVNGYSLSRSGCTKCCQGAHALGEEETLAASERCRDEQGSFSSDVLSDQIFIRAFLLLATSRHLALLRLSYVSVSPALTTVV
jgi:hypothetical protein